MTNRNSNVSADSLFRITDRSVLRSPMPRHIISLHSIGTDTPTISHKRSPIKPGKFIRPTPIVPALGIPTTRKPYNVTSSSSDYDRLKQRTIPEKFSPSEAHLLESSNDIGLGPCEKEVADFIPVCRQSFEVSSLPGPLIEDDYRPEKGIYMNRWHLRCISACGLNLPGDLGVWVVLKGIRKYKGQWKDWHSSAIVDRVDSRTVQTLSGQMYYLAGDVIADSMIKDGFSTALISRFSQGFPSDWKALVIKRGQDDGAGDLSTKSPPRKISNTSKDFFSKTEPIPPSPKALVDSSEIIEDGNTYSQELPLNADVILPKDVISVTRSGRRIKKPGAWWAKH